MGGALQEESLQIPAPLYIEYPQCISIWDPKWIGSNAKMNSLIFVGRDKFMYIHVPLLRDLHTLG